MEGKSDKPSGSEGDSQKKKPFEQLSKEDLIKKCKGLLGLAQKAKQARDEYAEENSKLSIKLSEYETQKDADKKSIMTMKEIVDNLTENKLSLASQISNYQEKNEKLEQTIIKLQNLEKSNNSELEIENESLKRQVKRLTDENEDLINDLQKMEDKFRQISEYGKQQKIDIELIEKETDKLLGLQEKFDETVEENLKEKINIMENNHIDNIKSLESDWLKKVQDIEAKYSKQYEEIEKLKNTEEKQTKKIQYLKTKLIDILAKLKKLKNCKKILLQTQLEYSESVAKWQCDITNASKQLVSYINVLENKLKTCNENEYIQKENDNPQLLSIKYESKVSELLIYCDNAIKVFNDKSAFVEKVTIELENLKRYNEILQENCNKQAIKLNTFMNKEINEIKSATILDNQIKIDQEMCNKYELKLFDLLLCCDNAIKEFNEKTIQNEKLLQNLKELQTLNSNLVDENNCLKQELSTANSAEQINAQETDDMKEVFSKYEKVCKELCDLEDKFNKNSEELQLSKIELENISEKNISLNKNIKKFQRETEDFKINFEIITKDLNQSMATNEEIHAKNEELHAKYEEVQTKNEELQIHSISTEKSLKQELGDLKERLKFIDEEKLKLTTDLEENIQIIERMKFENTDLLAEMRELNEALKGRGDVISRQQDKITELETELKKLLNNSIKSDNLDKTLNQQQISSSNTTNSETVSNKNIKDETLLCVTSHSKSNLDVQSDILSVSSISRADDSVRMREIDDSFEDKYIKLRAVALKLKKKVQEQALHIAELVKENENGMKSAQSVSSSSASGNIKLGSVQMKNLQALQNENDRHLDEIDQLKITIKNKDKDLKELTDKLNIINQNLMKKDEELKQMEKIKLTKEQTISDFQNQIKSMKMEKDTFNLVRKELEKDRDNQKKNAEQKDNENMKITEQLEKAKKELDKLRSVSKQSNVLNLEIEAYEKSLNDVSQKLEGFKVQNKELTETVKCKEDTITSMKKEIKLLEENVESEKQHSQELKQQIDIQQQKLKQIEYDKIDLQTKIQDSIIEIETKKTELDELRLQLSTITLEKDKLCTSLQTEKENLYRQLINLEEKFDTTQLKLKSTNNELDTIRTDYASYKVRAQSVLRQNQSKESSREKELEEELNVTQTNRDALNVKLTKSLELIAVHEKNINNLKEENEREYKRCKELIEILEESRLQHDTIVDENRKQIEQYQETIKTNRLQIETLNKCYKQQLDELETKYTKELDNMKKQQIYIDNSNKIISSRIGPFGGGAVTNNTPASISSVMTSHKSLEEQKIDLILMEREDAEGSEASYTMPKRKISTRSKHEIMPLDELLNTSIDENPKEFIDDNRSMSPAYELQLTKDKLHAQESRTRHLTSLLAETEQDLVKFTQLNEVLKEELRRHERTVEREKHMHNSEYLKNVVLKFLTLTSGDERVRLVPVLNTILKLSPDETHTLQNVAKGLDVGNRGWGSYLPIWSNHQ